MEILGADIPIHFSTGFSGIGGKITIILAVFVVAFITMGVFALLYYWRVYKYKVVIFENIAGRGYFPSAKDKARLIRIGKSGEEILWLKNKKLPAPAYGSRKMGTNTYWFAIGQDGYLYNIVLGDLDAKMGMLDIEPIDRDVRGFYVANQRNIEQRYSIMDAFSKYAPLVISGMLVLALLIGGWFMLDKIAEISGTASSTAKSILPAYQELADKLGAITARLESINTGTGIVPAGG